ncbi:hypothetical protein [Corynebacterium mayonis]|uniref:hypothetical protein n=1 Tax=Corynebacterium mayonis TaxID=3062461 RepID=UPI0031403043
MKLRNGIVAALTAGALVTAGVALPAQAQTTATTTATTTAAAPAPTTPAKPTPTAKNESSFGSSDDWNEKNSKEKAEEIKSWLSVITAIIGVLSAIGGFAAKYITMF